MLCPSLGSWESAPQGSFLLAALLGAGAPCAYFCACWRPFSRVTSASRVTLAGNLLLSALLPVGQLQAVVEEGRSHALGCSRVTGTEELLTRAPADAWKRRFTINVWKLLNFVMCNLLWVDDLLKIKFSNLPWILVSKVTFNYLNTSLTSRCWAVEGSVGFSWICKYKDTNSWLLSAVIKYLNVIFSSWPGDIIHSSVITFVSTRKKLKFIVNVACFL